MSLVHFRDKKGNLITLDAITNVNITRSGNATTTTVQSGKPLTDHYHSSKATITLAGVITSSKLRPNRASSPPSPKDLVKLINDVMDSATPFTLLGSPDVGIPSYNTCLISNFSIVKGMKNLDSLEVALTIQEIDIGAEAQQGYLAPSKSTNSQLASKEGSGAQGAKIATKVDDSKYTRLRASVKGGG